MDSDYSDYLEDRKKHNDRVLELLPRFYKSSRSDREKVGEELCRKYTDLFLGFTKIYHPSDFVILMLGFMQGSSEIYGFDLEPLLKDSLDSVIKSKNEDWDGD